MLVVDTISDAGTHGADYLFAAIVLEMRFGREVYEVSKYKQPATADPNHINFSVRHRRFTSNTH